MTLRILHDIHAGVLRSAGTTPASALALRLHIRERFKSLLPKAGNLMLLGDIFDTGNVPLTDSLGVYEILADWLAQHPESTLYNVAGNHDLAKTSTVLSSFQFVGRLLARQFPNRYVHIEEPAMTPYGYAIPHLRNQDIFNLALAGVPSCERLFVHCNIDNNFAAQSDQSLNISADQLEALPVREVICAHEHHRRTVGKVIIPGNQIASSVSDWLSNGDKFFAQIVDGQTELIKCGEKATEFAEMDWQNLTPTEHKFVRITGTASPEQISATITKINRFRAASSAFVVSNAVTQTSEAGDSAEMFSQSLESVAKFDIMEALRRILTQEEMQELEALNAL